MIAEKRKWGNEGSFYAISKALNINFIVISVALSTNEILSITKYTNQTVKSNIPLIIINIPNTHFIAVHRASKSDNFSGKNWCNKQIRNINLSDEFGRHRKLYETRKKF